MTFDDIRALHPTLQVNVYAMTPGGVVTLEIIDSGVIYTFEAETEQAAIDKAFPPVETPAEPIEEPFNILD